MRKYFKNIVFTLLLLNTATASAIIIDGGPTWTPPGMGTVTTTGTEPATSGGLTYTYTGMDLNQTENLYYGIKNDAFLNGYSMDGVAISGNEIFRFSSAGVNSIIYTGTTIIETLSGIRVEPTRMTLTFTGPGIMIQDATTMALNNANGDVGALWHVMGDFSVNILMEALVVEPGDSNLGNWEPGNDLFDRLQTVGVSASGTGSSVDTGFYYEAAIDTDGDGVVDNVDNCILVHNPAQRDTDGDGYGNYCDPDLNNDLTVNAADLALFKPLFFTTDPDADFDGNGRVQAGDLAILKSFFFKAPGPSGLNP